MPAKQNWKVSIGTGRSFGIVITLAEDRLAPVEVTADTVQVHHAATANLGSRDRLGFHPAPHHVFRDVFQAQHLREDRLRAERRGAEVRDLFHSTCDGEPHYSRLFHVFPLYSATGCLMRYVQITHVHNTQQMACVHKTFMVFCNERASF